MNQPIESYTQADTPVLETHSVLFASVVCDSLENAGIPARLYSNGHYCVEVPAALLAAARRLLFTEPRSGEIYGYCG